MVCAVELEFVAAGSGSSNRAAVAVVFVVEFILARRAMRSHKAQTRWPNAKKRRGKKPRPLIKLPAASTFRENYLFATCSFTWLANASAADRSPCQVFARLRG